MIETSDKQSLEMQKAVMNKVKGIYNQVKKEYFDTISLGNKTRSNLEALKFLLIALPLNFEEKLLGLVGF